MRRKAIHAVVVRRTQVYRLIVDTNSESAFEKNDAEAAAINKVNEGEDAPGVEYLGWNYDVEILASVEASKVKELGQ